MTTLKAPLRYSQPIKYCKDSLLVHYGLIITSPVGAVAKYCDEYVCLSVCLSARISPEPHERSLPNFLCMLPMSVAGSSFGTLMIGPMVRCREGVFFPTDKALSAGKGG